MIEKHKKFINLKKILFFSKKYLKCSAKYTISLLGMDLGQTLAGCRSFLWIQESDELE